MFEWFTNTFGELLGAILCVVFIIFLAYLALLIFYKLCAHIPWLAIGILVVGSMAVLICSIIYTVNRSEYALYAQPILACLVFMAPHGEDALEVDEYTVTEYSYNSWTDTVYSTDRDETSGNVWKTTLLSLLAGVFWWLISYLACGLIGMMFNKGEFSLFGSAWGGYLLCVILLFPVLKNLPSFIKNKIKG